MVRTSVLFYRAPWTIHPKTRIWSNLEILCLHVQTKTKCHQLWVLCAIEKKNTCKTFFAILWHTPDQTVSVYFMYFPCPYKSLYLFWDLKIHRIPFKHHWANIFTEIAAGWVPRKILNPQNTKMLISFTTQQISCIIQSSLRISNLKTASWFELREAFPFKGPVRIHGKSKLHTLKLTCSPLKMDENGPSQKERIVFQSHPFSGAKAVSFGRG